MNEGIKKERSHCGPASLVAPKPRQRQQRASVLPHMDMQAETASLLTLTQMLMKTARNLKEPVSRSRTQLAANG